jgi:hypothetical protein
MHVHLQQKKKQPMQPLDIAHRESPAASSEVQALSRFHAMAMPDSTFKVFFWADLQGKQGGVMQRDEITQRNHQL